MAGNERTQTKGATSCCTFGWKKYCTGDPVVFVKNNWLIISKLWTTGRSFLTWWFHHSDSNKASPLPRDPVSMIRSYLLLLLTHPIMSMTKWVDVYYILRFIPFLADLNPSMFLGWGIFMLSFNVYGEKLKPNVKPKLKLQRKKWQKKSQKGKKHPRPDQDLWKNKLN